MTNYARVYDFYTDLWHKSSNMSAPLYSCILLSPRLQMLERPLPVAADLMGHR